MIRKHFLFAIFQVKSTLRIIPRLLLCGIIFLAVYAFVFFTNKMILEDYLFSVTKILSLLLLILASAKMIKKDYSQWMLYIGYAIVSGVSNVFFAINSGYLLKCILDDDAFKIYDMIELDIQLEEHGLPCIIS